MNRLIVGTDTEPFHEPYPVPFLLIDDGELIDTIELPPRRKIIYFDVSKHHFNPLKNLDYKKARDFVSVLDAVFPEGQNTLTKKNSNFVLLNALLDNPTKLSKLIPEPKNTKDTGLTDAYQKIQTLLLSPVLYRVFERATNFPLNATILARLNRAELGDFDCFVLANLLISHYPHQVVIPDFGFYGRLHHTNLIRQNRLIAGVTSLSRVSPELREELLLIPDKVGAKCTAEDAETLAGYSRHRKGSEGYIDLVEQLIKGTA